MQKSLLHQTPEHIRERLQVLQSNAGSASLQTDTFQHLRPHQSAVVAKAISHTLALSQEELTEPKGASFLHPTGSGKTVSAIGVVDAITRTPDTPLTTLHLVPSTLIAEGTLDKYLEFAPGLTPVRYSTELREIDSDVCVMTYQALAGALDRPNHLPRFDPDVIILDEAHHLIDGAWAEQVRALARGRYVLGMTATPAYTRARSVQRLLPTVLDHKTFRDGLSEGFIAAFNSQIVPSKVHDSSDAYGVVLDAHDLLHYVSRMAAAQKIGLISCVGGDDRAHARLVETLAREIQVAGENRTLRVERVDGTMTDRQVRDTLSDLKNRRIDAVAYTQLLGEGVDLPELDYLGILGWTRSFVKASQRLGRITRPGRPKEVREYLREGEGYVSHRDTLEETFTLGDYIDDEPRERQGEYGSNAQGKWMDYSKLIMAADRLKDPGDAGHEEVEDLMKFGHQNGSVGFEWKNTSQIAAKLMMTEEQVEALAKQLQLRGIELAFKDHDQTYFAQESLAEMVGALKIPHYNGLESVPVDKVYRALRQKINHRGGKSQFLRLLREKGIEPSVAINAETGEVEHVVPISSLAVLPPVERRSLNAFARILKARAEPKNPAPRAIKNTASNIHNVRRDPDDKFAERALEFLVSLASKDDMAPEQKQALGRNLSNLQRSLHTAGSIPRSEVKLLAHMVESLDKQSLLYKNLISMGERQHLSPERVLGAILSVARPER